MPIYERSSIIDSDRQQLFQYHARPGALQRLIPPWESVDVVKQDPSIDVGSQVILRQRMFGIPLTWLASHKHLSAPEFFEDVQVSGPFARWQHEHHLEVISDRSSRLLDRVRYEVPFGFMGRLANGFVANKLDAMFGYRHRTTQADLKICEFLAPHSQGRSLRIGVTGSSGMIGRRLIDLISVLGHTPTRILRRESMDRAIGYPYNALSCVWTEGSGFHLKDNAEGLDAVIHLAGKGIASGRWTSKQKQAIYHSRVNGTRQLVLDLMKLDSPPKSIVCASGVGYYGDQGNEQVSEADGCGTDFLATLARDWEGAAMQYESSGNRVAVGRLGMVLHPKQGALPKLLLPCWWCLGGTFGDGNQYWPWIDVDDAAAAFLFLALSTNAVGAYNFVAPQSVTNKQFSAVLAKVMKRPNWITVPRFVLRTMLGEMADAMLLSSTNAGPKRLLELGFPFRSETLESGLRHVLGRSLAPPS